MKTLIRLVIITVVASTLSCKKNHNDDNNQTPPDNYLSMEDFYAQNGASLQTFTVSGSAGGTLTTPQGTTIIIPADAFITQAGVIVTGSVTVQFKDIYKKSDMLLSNIPTTYSSGTPLKSGGEFFIKAMANGGALNLLHAVTVKQPLLGIAVDSGMQAMFGFKNAFAGPGGLFWQQPDSALGFTGNGSVSINASQYIFSLYDFSTPADSGTWCNSDNPDFFSAYPQTAITMHPLDTTFIGDVFLIFKNQRSMVHVYNSGVNYPYNYAPVGLQAIVVAVGLKGGELYSAFVPITISNNMTVNFGVTLTTTETFKAELEALN